MMAAGIAFIPAGFIGNEYATFDVSIYECLDGVVIPGKTVASHSVYPSPVNKNEVTLDEKLCILDS